MRGPHQCRGAGTGKVENRALLREGRVCDARSRGFLSKEQVLQECRSRMETGDGWVQEGVGASADTHVLFWRFYCFLSFNQTVHEKQEDTEEELKPPGDYASAAMITYATLALTLTHTHRHTCVGGPMQWTCALARCRLTGAPQYSQAHKFTFTHTCARMRGMQVPAYALIHGHTNAYTKIQYTYMCGQEEHRNIIKCAHTHTQVT